MADPVYLSKMLVQPGEVADRGPAVTARPGFCTRDEVVARCLARMPGADLSTLASFDVLDHWRSACIANAI